MEHLPVTQEIAGSNPVTSARPARSSVARTAVSPNPPDKQAITLEGGREEDLLDGYPRLTREDIRAAIAYAAEVVAHEENLLMASTGRRSSQSGVWAISALRHFVVDATDVLSRMCLPLSIR